MSTTTIHLPDDLKERLDRAAKQAGTSAHAFILEAIAEKADQEELQADFNREADRRLAQWRELKDVIPWDEARLYLEAMAAGQTIDQPATKKQPR